MRLSRQYYVRRWLILGATIMVLLLPLIFGVVTSGRLQRFKSFGKRAPAKIVSHSQVKGKGGVRHTFDIEYAVGRGRFNRQIEVSDLESKNILARLAPTVLILDGDPENAYFGEINQETINAPWRKVAVAMVTGLFVCAVAYVTLATKSRAQRRALGNWTPARARVTWVDYGAAVWPYGRASALSGLAAVTLRYPLQNVFHEVTINTRKDLTPGRGAAVLVNPEAPEEVVLVADCDLVELVPAWKVLAGPS